MSRERRAERNDINKSLQLREMVNILGSNKDRSDLHFSGKNDLTIVELSGDFNRPRLVLAKADDPEGPRVYVADADTMNEFIKENNLTLQENHPKEAAA
ncbi:MAG: hypothetical protein V1838_00685 [Patescibacteria group bacterium]